MHRTTDVWTSNGPSVSSVKIFRLRGKSWPVETTVTLNRNSRIFNWKSEFWRALQAAFDRSEEVSGYLAAEAAWRAALEEVPLSLEELKLYKQLTAIHGINGVELFAIGEN